jgi:hypothetical protein
MLTMIEREQYLRQQTLKQEIRAITIVLAGFVLIAFLIIVASNRQAFRNASTNTLSSASDSSIPATPAGSQAARRPTNPFQGFRNVGRGQ